MKFFILLLVFSQSIWARQYIQCSGFGESNIVAVVNVATANDGTFFISSGMQNDENERLLCPFSFQSEDQDQIYFSLKDTCTGSLSFEKKYLNQPSDKLEVEATVNGVFLQLICFSRIYND